MNFKHFIIGVFLLWALPLSAVEPVDSIAADTERLDSVVVEDSLPKDSVAVKPKKPHKQIFYGMSAHLDVASPLINYLVDKSTLSFEACVDVDLLHKYFPIVEVGFGYADKLNDDGIHYKVRAPFYRIGLNYNILRMKDKGGNAKVFTGSYPYVGVRYGFSLFKYSLDGVMIHDDYWGVSRPLVVNPKYIYAGWAELVAGVRVNMVKGFTMGWNVRLGLLSHSSQKSAKAQLWYVPGFGKQNTVNFMFNYTFGYTFDYQENKSK